MKHGPIFDRALEPSWMDIALTLAADGGSDLGKQLDAKLQDRIESVEGRKKTVRVISRVWLRPRAQIEPLIHWAIERAAEVGDSRPLHLGGILAAYPFFGDACRIIGRALSLDGQVETGELRRGLKERWGDRDVVNVASRCVIRTLRAFGVLTGSLGLDRSEQAEAIPVSPPLTQWVTHSLILSRGTDEIEKRMVTSAPELFMFKLGAGWREPYALLERFSEGGDRMILRRAPNSLTGSADSQRTLFR